MPIRQLRGDLTEVLRLIADGRTELNRRTGDREDYWLDSARHRLGEQMGAVIEDCADRIRRTGQVAREPAAAELDAARSWLRLQRGAIE